MAVYGVSPYAMPSEIAIGCMMNIRMAQAWKSTPLILAIGTALGSKESIAEMQTAVFCRYSTGESSAKELMRELKLGMHDL
jgi:hypothetical protein